MPPIRRKRATKASDTPPATSRTAQPSHLPQPPDLAFQLEPARFGLIRGIMARPVLFTLLAKYPTPEDLSLASSKDLTIMLQPLGLHNIRAMRLIALVNA